MSEYWNPPLETLPREQLRDVQLRKFREQAEYAYTNSPFYRQKFDAAGIDPQAIDSFADVRDVPTTTKDELRDAQRGEDLYGDLLAVEHDRTTEYHQTSGTTGKPVRQTDSWRDWEWWGDCWATVLWAAGIREHDRVFFPFSYNVFVAFWAAHYAAERIGAEVVPGGNLSSAQRVRKIDELDVTAFTSTPTYALRLAEVARDEGFEPDETSVDTIVCAGEPGASVPGTKNRIEAEWGASVYDHAGATEAGAWGFSCDESVGLHINEARFLVEVIDEDGEPVAPGETGEIVLTPLDREAQPYIRFEIRDRLAVGEYGGCDCDRSYRHAPGGIKGRADDLTKVNGVLLSPTAIEDVVRSFDHVADEYEVTIDQHPTKEIDQITLVAEVAPASELQREAIEDELRKELKETTKLTFDIELVSYETIDRPELKADRLTDNRHTHV